MVIQNICQLKAIDGPYVNMLKDGDKISVPGGYGKEDVSDMGREPIFYWVKNILVDNFFALNSDRPIIFWKYRLQD